MKDFSLTSRIQNDTILLDLTVNNEKYIGKSGTIDLLYYAQIHDSRPADRHIFLSQKPVAFTENMEFSFELDKIRPIYVGKQLSINYQVKIHIDNTFLLFDKDIVLALPLGRDYVNGLAVAQNVFVEKDTFEYKKEFQVLHPGIKGLLGIIFLTFLYFVGSNIYHGIWIPFQGSGDFHTSMLFPVFISIILNIGFFGVPAIFIILLGKKFTASQFLDYKFFADQLRNNIQITDIFSGVAKAHLKDVTVRASLVVFEKGKYWRSNGSSEIEVSFSTPIQKTNILEQEIPVIAKGENINMYLSGKLDYEEFQPALLPTIILDEIQKTFDTIDYGVVQTLQIEIISPEYVDIVVSTLLPPTKG